MNREPDLIRLQRCKARMSWGNWMVRGVPPKELGAPASPQMLALLDELEAQEEDDSG